MIFGLWKYMKIVGAGAIKECLVRYSIGVVTIEETL